jgi:hypothetical protein
MNLFKQLKISWSEFVKRFSSVEPAPEIHITEDDQIIKPDQFTQSGEIKIGIDPGKPEGDQSVISITSVNPETQQRASRIMIPVVLNGTVRYQPLLSFSEAYKQFKSFICNGQCMGGEPGECTHIFVFACSECGKPIRAIYADMENFSVAGDDNICMKCFEAIMKKDLAA